MARQKYAVQPSDKLFADDQRDLFEKSYEERLQEEKNKAVECLGMTFENDEKRREYFLKKLREKLKDPEFRKIEGFPIGEDEDFLALSDPPYYTACPNPFIVDFIKHYGKPYDPNVPYSREPFAADSQFGKTSNAITRAHPYHTKVPPEAVQAFAAHYLDGRPGVFLDCFCGIGMSGVGLNLYQKDDCEDVAIIQCDLSTIASFVAHNYNSRVDSDELEKVLNSIADQLEMRIEKFYATRNVGWLASGKQPDVFDQNNRDKSDGDGTIQYVLLAEELTCPNCGALNLLWRKDCIDIENGKVKDFFPCCSCGSQITKRDCSRIWETHPDPCVQESVWRIFRQRPVLILYEYAGRKYCKYPDADDIVHLKEHWNSRFGNIPIVKIPDGDKTRELISGNTDFFHQCYYPATLEALNELQDIVAGYSSHRLYRRIKYALSPMYSSLTRMAVLHVSHFFKGGGGPFISNISGFLHFPSISFIRNPVSTLRLRIKSIVNSEAARTETWGKSTVTSCQSATDIRQIPDSVVDYVFVDPPFGQNLMYSELNFFWESALGVRTNSIPEAIINRTQHKDLRDYQNMMTEAFREINRVLKPGRWLTVEFHNSKNAVWIAIQEAIELSGFIVADVRILDKKLGSYNQNVSTGAPKSDLIISAYKPNGGLEDRFKLTAGTEEGVWDFVRTHLKQLPVFVSKDGQAEIIAERQNYLLFDRMVAFHVQRGVTVPSSVAEFYASLEQRFPPRDSMYFLPDQTAEYDKKRMTVKEVLQLQLFVSDEASAIQWLKQQLTKKPQTFQDIHPQFLKEIGGWQKHEKALELSELLAQNFLRYDGKGEVPSQIHSYLSSNFKELRNLAKDDSALKAKGKDRRYVPDPNKAGDLEKLRERALMREFEEYRESKQKRLKVFRLEAVRTGFKKAWQERDYATIIAVARKIPDKILQEDPKLLMWYDQAVTRMGGD
jgi:16S rRNA G966 N2-methylase RsmD